MSTALTTSDPPKPNSLSTEKAGRVLDLLEAELGGRENLYTALLAAPPSTDLDYVVGLIADPRNDLRRLSTVCAQGKITLGEFLAAFRAGIMAPALTKAMALVAAKVPEITAEVVNRAVTHEGDCSDCSGRGTAISTVNGVQVATPCLYCGSTGRRIIQPDFEQQKFVLTTLAEMGPKKAPAMVIDQSDHRSITMDVSAQAHGKLLAAADKVLYGRRPDRAAVIDAPVDSSDTAVDADA